MGGVLTQQRIRLQKFLNVMAVRYLGQPHTSDSKERGMFARSWPVGTTALWIAGLLSAYLLFYYL
jgi:multicomponent Na+:H+ antiporter subunit D